MTQVYFLQLECVAIITTTTVLRECLIDQLSPIVYVIHYEWQRNSDLYVLVHRQIALHF